MGMLLPLLLTAVKCGGADDAVNPRCALSLPRSFLESGYRARVDLLGGMVD